MGYGGLVLGPKPDYFSGPPFDEGDSGAERRITRGEKFCEAPE